MGYRPSEIGMEMVEPSGASARGSPSTYRASNVRVCVILDNISAHKTKQVETFLDTHPTVRLHFTPTYASWLNQVELWLAKIERDLIARGIFTSQFDLKRKIMRYIRALQQISETREVEVCRSPPSNYSHFACYSPLVLFQLIIPRLCYPFPNQEGEDGQTCPTEGPDSR
jgi:hypothetical protein